jgi:protein TonB
MTNEDDKPKLPAPGVGDPPREAGATIAPVAGEAAAVKTDLVASIALAPTDPGQEATRLGGGSVTLSLIGHGAIVGLLLAGTALPAMVGEGAEPDSIGVEIVPATALASAVPSAEISSSAPAAIAERSGGIAQAVPTEAAADQSRAAEKPAEAGGEIADLAIPDWKRRFEQPDAEALTLSIAARIAEQEKAAAEEREAEAAKAATASAASVATPSVQEGAMLASGTASEGEADSRAKAAAGAALTAYNRELVAVLATLQRHVQRSAGRSGGRKTGVLKLRLTIDPAGQVERLGIETSSGDQQLDRQAMAAVQSFAFPPPPRTATAAERTYLLPITYR